MPTESSLGDRTIQISNFKPLMLPPSPSCTTPANDDPDLFFNDGRDLCYLRLVFALAGNSNWHPHLFRDCHIDWCISMIPQYCNASYYEHPFFTSVTSLDSVTEQQWWDMMRSVWIYPRYDIDNARTFKLLLVFVNCTKKYMQIASKSDLEQLIENVDEFVERLEQDIRWKRRLHEIGQETQDLEQGEGVIFTAKELRTTASNMMVESFEKVTGSVMLSLTWYTLVKREEQWAWDANIWETRIEVSTGAGEVVPREQN
ncbi:uncharacterized protein F5147DRAFT_660589 [Suillus discolor]|uniref:Uncharacterized protein n=1 Tax=Suillus discolor TaxID=1912936 RepID=A0A9P7ER36_9AGAM|nr:uncharacterized protein F5147DRAFT_660589 [Suillus discolor]KAG2082070.1 hypothetical protein F5147DRAFT_660589 [Suillus discolor]